MLNLPQIDGMLPKKIPAAVLVLLLAGAMAMAGCRAAGLGFLPELAAVVETPTRIPSATATQRPSATPTATPVPPTPTQTTTPTPSPSPTLDVAQGEILAELWQAINEEYLYEDFNGVDWPALYEAYRARIDSGLTRKEFYLAMDELIFSLGDDHSFFLDPTQVVQQRDELEGRQSYVGIGIELIIVAERERVVVLLTREGSPAQEAGLRHRDSILAADGQPIIDEHGSFRDIIRGPEGTNVTLTIQTPGQEPREVLVERRQIDGGLRVPYRLLKTPSGQRIGYLLLPSFTDNTIPDQVTDAIRALSEAAPLDGMIVDNRWNRGGLNTVFRGTIRHFTGGILGYYFSRNGQRILRINPLDIEGSQDFPLVVLVGQETYSFGEIFSGILSDRGRALLIGETTDGNVETLWAYDFVDGSRAWLAHDAFRPYHDPAQDWELSGIIPDLEVVADWYAYTLDEDPVVLAALDHLDTE